MNPEAIILMVVTILIIWGGLIASIVAFREATKRKSRNGNYAKPANHKATRRK